MSFKLIIIMRGFIIYINDKTKYAGVDNGVTVIIVDETSLKINIKDNILGFSHDFGTIKLKLGDKIRIKVSEIEGTSAPSNTKPLNRQKLLLEYNELKEFLIKEGRLLR